MRGPIAQLEEPPAHNREVPGSRPGGPMHGMREKSGGALLLLFFSELRLRLPEAWNAEGAPRVHPFFLGSTRNSGKPASVSSFQFLVSSRARLGRACSRPSTRRMHERFTPADGCRNLKLETRNSKLTTRLLPRFVEEPFFGHGFACGRADEEVSWIQD
jgi:hypothetical protein